jgi:hypothetical protein
MSKGEEDLPGVTLNLVDAKIQASFGPSDGDVMKYGTITVGAQIRDVEIWEKILVKMDGMKVYSSATLEEAAMEIACSKADDAEEKYKKEVTTLRSDLEVARQKNSWYQAEIVKLKERVEHAQTFAKIMEHQRDSTNHGGSE